MKAIKDSEPKYHQGSISIGIIFRVQSQFVPLAYVPTAAFRNALHLQM